MSAENGSSAAVPRSVAKNIDTVMQIEQRAREERSHGDRLGDAVSRIVGSLPFTVAHGAFIACWLLINTGSIAGIAPFDPYPFSFLALIVSMEAVFLTTFVLMSQNRQNKQADHRSHLHLQVDMLAEQETTKIMQMLEQICQRLGVEAAAQDNTFKEMTTNTAVGALARELTHNLKSSRAHERQ